MPLFTHIYCLISLIFGYMPTQSPLPGGLKFHGSEEAINQRTSYNVLGDRAIEFSEQFSIECNLSLYPATEIGYIVRIKNRKSDRIFNLFYDGQGDNLIFKFNEEGKDNLIVAQMNRDELLNTQWFNMRISFDLTGNSINLTINNQSFSAKNQKFEATYSPVILFGKSDHVIDVPSFAIKDLSVESKETYSFPLLENEGNIVHDMNGNPVGKVVNPDWLKNYAYHWNHQTSFKSQAIAGAGYNSQRKELYYFNRDSIHIYNVRSGDKRIEIFKQKCPVKLVLGTNFIDTTRNKLYTYEVYYDTPYDGPTVASLDLDTFEWTVESYEQLPTQLHHHSSYLNNAASEYTIFGGFGNMKYSKSFFSFDLATREWIALEDFSGDFLSPRYFSSLGYEEKKSSLYVFGGMGNESGEQAVGRKYYYDLYQVDLNSNQITKRWEIPWGKDNIVPVRGMFTLNDSTLFTLCYPEHFSQSTLKLYRFSLKDGNYEILGDSIPIISDKITTNANLYFDSGLNNLYAVVQEFEDDISSELNIYSLAFPAITAAELSDFPVDKSNNLLVIILLLSGSAIAIGYLLLQKQKPIDNPIVEEINKGIVAVPRIERKTRPNSIYLFGTFTVRDRKNRDITYMFSTQLKQVFCLILQYSTSEDGITSQHLSNLLWPDRPADKVKNSRGVTINNLRKTLSELDGIELIHEKGYYKIILHEEAYCDYSRCLELASTHEMDVFRDEFAEIVGRGKFLYLADDYLFDEFKEEAEAKLEPILLVEIEKSFEAGLYHTTISLAEAIFNIDPLNELALACEIKAMQKLKAHEEAKIKYRAFALEYKKVTGNDYPHTFMSLVNS
ncbi:two-component SAPR family response regulator [Algoriphagus sp. 4150]|uniref:Kelch repeat-containing protein n=1 Tax=Algoriphagus sp. 4150 TaxID=2817756 RepID=UPI00285CB203|nr:DNA-binding transcriptional activator [Algoriphagus sp. 4150]MDR7131234.1 two-component SAPR family response regulator [Algoriphagus sp. 4150]